MDQMNTLKAKRTFKCGTCDCNVKRTKSIKVAASTKEDAFQEANVKIANWINEVKDKDCRVCTSIKRDLAA